MVILSYGIHLVITNPSIQNPIYMTESMLYEKLSVLPRKRYKGGGIPPHISLITDAYIDDTNKMTVVKHSL